MFSKRLVAALALVAAGTFATNLAFAGDDAAKPAAPAAKADAPKTAETPATKTPTPFHSVLGFLAKQVAPDLECACPAKAEGEKAWRSWFDGGANVPMAALRDRLVADGWTADRFVTFFKDMSSKSCGDCSKGDCAKGDCAKGDCAKGDCAKGDCAKGDCAKGCCEGKGERADGKGCCGKCKKDGEAAKPAEGTAPAAPAATPAKP
jgi:hypothetical protein